jgi:hypothetical protein
MTIPLKEFMPAIRQLYADGKITQGEQEVVIEIQRSIAQLLKAGKLTQDEHVALLSLSLQWVAEENIHQLAVMHYIVVQGSKSDLLASFLLDMFVWAVRR